MEVNKSRHTFLQGELAVSLVLLCPTNVARFQWGRKVRQNVSPAQPNARKFIMDF